MTTTTKIRTKRHTFMNMCSTYRTAEAHFGRVLPGVHLITVDVTWVVDGLEVPLVLRVAAKVLLEVAVPHQLQSAKIPNTMII